ncbi:MAG: single-stranded DNA-binding protein [Bacteroidales bacterium]|nr:single-stranded DNA-binding protein [Bacteroidales bacterium]
MEQLNRIELKGVVGTIRIQTVSDRKVARIWMVTNRAYKNREGEPVIEETWHNVSAWEGRDIQNLEQIKKGAPLHVIGRMRSQQYTAADGSERYSYDVAALRVELINPGDEFLCES